MHIEVGLVLLGVFVVLFGGLGSLLGRWSITMPMVFVATGIIIGPYGLGLLQITPDNELVKTITEATLAMLLFADASTLDFDSLRHDVSLPARLLGIGLP